jgi:hypothetical protein
MAIFKDMIEAWGRLAQPRSVQLQAPVPAEPMLEGQIRVSKVKPIPDVVYESWPPWLRELAQEYTPELINGILQRGFTTKDEIQAACTKVQQMMAAQAKMLAPAGPLLTPPKSPRRQRADMSPMGDRPKGRP